MNSYSILFLIWIIFCVCFLFSSLKGEVLKRKLPIKFDLEYQRTPHFMKILVHIRNEGSEEKRIKAKLSVFKGGNSNVSKIVQSKDIFLRAKETLIPFITEFSVNPWEYYSIKLEIYDMNGNILVEKTFEVS